MAGKAHLSHSQWLQSAVNHGISLVTVPKLPPCRVRQHNGPRYLPVYGAKLENVSVGCCGMAGTYGHEAKNHENSLGIYELSWHQAMQRLPRNRCLATGYSCRSQVKRVEGTGVRHPVQALLEIIK